MRTVCGCCAKADEAASTRDQSRAREHASCHPAHVVPPKWLRAATSRGTHAKQRHRAGHCVRSPHIGGVMPSRPTVMAGGFERAVGLLGGAGDEDLGAGLELVLAAGRVGHDRGLGRDDDLLLAVLVLDRDHLAVDALAPSCATVALVMVLFGSGPTAGCLRRCRASARGRCGSRSPSGCRRPAAWR